MKPDADAALRLLVGRDETAARSMTAWDDRSVAALEKVLRHNVVLLRVAEHCRELGAPVARLEDAARAERARIDGVLGIMGQLAGALEREGVGYVFTKAFQHLPDMGHDIDLFVGEDHGRIQSILERTVGARAARNTTVSRFAGKDAYLVADGRIQLEVHRGRLGHFGEHADLARALFAGRQLTTAASLRVWVPAPGDRLLLQVIQRVHAHRRIRVSDVLATLDLWGSATLDRERVLATARASGIDGALRWYLAVVNALAIRAGARGFEGIRPAGSVPAARAYGYPVPLGVVTRAYVSALGADLRGGDLGSAARIAAIPALAVAAVIDRGRRRAGL